MEKQPCIVYNAFLFIWSMCAFSCKKWSTPLLQGSEDEVWLRDSMNLVAPRVKDSLHSISLPPSRFLQDFCKTPTNLLANHMHFNMVLEAHVALDCLRC
mmetsp:Transcript_4355/g.27706  ORF Transcript_4355/g.27706 Transcript_4355/m.27706 type:complete len:99 (-) Transcript_4355:2404-2700(-)